MSDFQYQTESSNRYFIHEIKIDGNAAQDGEPTTQTPVDVQTVSVDETGKFGISADGVFISIDLEGNELVKLPDGTKDELSIDSMGNAIITKRTGFYQVTGSETVAGHAYGSYVRAVLANVISNHPSVTVSQSTGYCTHATFKGDSTEESEHAYTTVAAVAMFAIAATAAEVLAAYQGAKLYYKLATPYQIRLKDVDLSKLRNLETAVSLTLVSSLSTTIDYSYNEHTVYDVKNPYEDYDAPEYAYPPNHFGQDWETFDANNWNKSEMLDYIGQPESHAVYTVELCELMQSGAFDWKRPELDWNEAAYNTEQYERFCKYFESRFMFREISMLPPLQWFTAFRRMMVYELMPKYKPLYAQVENGISPLGENEYYKERHVSSLYPETLLSGNSDYISSGEDKEFERIKIDNAAEALEAYRNGFRSVDAALGDELEVLFISMYTSFANAL